jgi:DNA-binding transcriptional LysR family regulator
VTGIIRRLSTQLGLHRRVVGQVTQLDLQLDLVRNGLGVAIVQGTLARSTHGVAVAELADPSIRWEVSLVSRAPGPVNPAAVALLDHLVPLS